MTRIQEINDQLKEETGATEKMFSRIPDDKMDWKPHERSMSLGELAAHVADMYGWIGIIIAKEHLDFAEPYDFPTATDSDGLLALLKQRVEASRTTLEGMGDDSVLEDTWRLRNGDDVLWEDKKKAIVRSTFGHIAHHRGQLSVYLRMNDIPVPATYGPSADEGIA